MPRVDIHNAMPKAFKQFRAFSTLSVLESKKRKTAQMLVDIKGSHLELFWGGG